MKARDLIQGALRQLGVLADGEQPTAAQAQDALFALNDLLDSWSTERLFVYQVMGETFSFVAGKQTYTMGPSGDWNTTRPVHVDKVMLQYQQSTPNLNLPIRMLDLDEYNRIRVPSTASTIPLSVYVDNGMPLRTFSFFTVPSTVNGVTVYSWQQLAQVASLDTVLAFPPGYNRALRYALAIEVADEYGTEVSGSVAAKAQDAKAKIKAQNSFSPLLRVDAALTTHGGAWNYLTGE